MLSSSEPVNQSLATPNRSKAFTIIAHILRIILGIIFLVFGLNGFLHFIPMPPPSGAAGEFFTGLVKAQYFLPLLAGVQVLCGILFISGALVPLALLILFPVSLNILFFHLELSPTGVGMAIFIMVANILLAVYYWPVFRPIFNSGNAWKPNANRQSINA